MPSFPNLRLMGIRADKSAVAAINRALQRLMRHEVLPEEVHAFA
jgi:hypothetical protein